MAEAQTPIIHKSKPLWANIFMVLAFYRKPMTADELAAIVYPDRERGKFTPYELKSLKQKVKVGIIIAEDRKGITYYGLPITDW